MQIRRFKVPILAGAIVVTLIALRVFAQRQINPMANNQVNKALYGGGTSGSVRYAGVNPEIRARTSAPMQSEIRHAYLKSGATPSEYRMGRAALGPMVEGGPISYINYKPSYLSTDKPGPSTPPMGSAAYTSMGSVRYASSAPPSANMLSKGTIDALVAPPKAVSPSLTHTTIQTSGASDSLGTVKYNR